MAKSTRRVILPQISRSAVYAAVGVESGNTIPLELSGEFPNVTLLDRYGKPVEGIPPVTLLVSKSHQWEPEPDETPETAEVREHYNARDISRRIFVVCPECSHRLPFANLPSHFTTKACDRMKEREAAKLDIGEKGEVYSVGKVPAGILLVWVSCYSAYCQVLTREGKYRKRIDFSFAACERFSMLYTNASAFGDWFNECDRMPPVGYARETDLAFWKEQFPRYAETLRILTREEWETLNHSSDTKAYALNLEETEDERKERNRERRKNLKTARNEWINRINAQFPGLLLD